MKKYFLPFALLFALAFSACKQESSTCCTSGTGDAGCIVLRAKMEIHRDSIESFKRLGKDLIEQTLKEQGCIEYGLYQDAYNPAVFFFFEEFKNAEAVAFHSKQPYLDAFKARRSTMMIGKPVAVKYNATEVK